MDIVYQPVIQTIEGPGSFALDVLRLDLIDPEISGNKWFKLRYNLEEAVKRGFGHIVTFGGAHSNHLAATAAACSKYGLRCTAVVRGEVSADLSPTLLKARTDGMNLLFVTREMYKNKESDLFMDWLRMQCGPHWLIPEGGNNAQGIEGCAEILEPDWDYRHVFCACGTGTTFAGLVASAGEGQWIHGMSVLKGPNTLPAEVQGFLDKMYPDKKLKVLDNTDISLREQHDINNAFALSGYAGFAKELIDFKDDFEKQYGIPLDHVYTAKLFYGVFKLMENAGKNALGSVLVIHSGGLQGNAAFERRYQLNPAR